MPTVATATPQKYPLPRYMQSPDPLLRFTGPHQHLKPHSQILPATLTAIAVADVVSLCSDDIVDFTIIIGFAVHLSYVLR